MSTDAPPPVPPAKRGCVGKLVRLGLLGVLLLAAGIFLARRQIGDVLARNLDERLSDAGIYITWKSAAWIPGPGIRLHGVEIFRDAAKTDRAFLLGNVAAIKGEPGWKKWDAFKVEARRADLVLDHGANETKLTGLHLDLVIQPGKAELERLQGDLLGWQVDAKGEYVKPTTPGGEKTPEEKEERKKGEGLLGDLKLDWLASVRDWATVKAGRVAPVLKLEFHSVPETGATTLAVNLEGKSVQWRGQPWDVMAADIKGTFGGPDAKPIEFERIEMGHGGQTARTKGTYDMAGKVLRVDEFESGVDVLALARAFAQEATAGLAAMSTSGQWRITGAGHIPLDDPKAGVWKGHLALTGDLTYAKEKTRVVVREPGLAVEMDKGVVNLQSFKAGLWGGELVLPATSIVLGEKGAAPTFKTEVRLVDASLQDISHSFGSGANQPGVVNVNWSGGGSMALPGMEGAGTLSIQKAEFYRVPLLGPLSLIFDQLAPGFGRDVASDLTASHSLGKGILSIRNLHLDSKYTRIEANGDLNLQSNYAKMTAKAKLQGIVGLTTALLSALLELEGEGPMNNMKWGLKNLPAGAIVKGATEVVGATGGMVLKGGEAAVNVTKDAANVTKDAATGTVKEAGKAVKGILKIPGKLIPGRK